MNSFYGGKQGSSFIISQTYSTIKEMLDDFGKNNRSCAVNFDEYVLINTVNKNNPENGQVFRRGYDYNSSRKIKTYQPTYGQANPYETIEVPANGAVYIGTIVGPAGRTPIFNFGHYEDVQDSCALLTRTFTDMGLNKSDSQQTIVTTLNKNYPNGKEILKEGELEKSFYSLKIVDNLETPSISLYFCYDNKYKLSNQEYSGWYAVDSRPATGEDSFRPEEGKGLIPGITYAYENGKLQYVVDPKTKKRSIKTGLNDLGNTYQDTIDWTYCTVRNENLEDSTAYIGFRFASPVVEFETESVNPYFHRNDTINESGEDPTEEVPDEQKTNDFENLNLIERIQTEEEIKAHPFYSKWKINIPKGIKGESIKNIYIVDAATATNIKKFVLNDNGELTYAANGAINVEAYEEDMSPPKNKADIESSKNKMIIVYDYVCYDRLPEGEKHTIYLGDFNKLDGIKLEHHGELVFDYSHDNTERTPQDDWIHWIDAMKFADDGTITITFNDRDWDGNKNIDTDITPQDDIISGVLTKDRLIKWINKFSLDKETGHLYIEFNNNNVKGLQTKNIGTKEEPKFVSFIEQDLTWVKDIEFQKDGTVITDYTTNYEEGTDKRVQKHLMSWIKNMNFNQDGTVTVDFNNNSLNDGQIVNGNITLPNLIKWITAIKLDEKTGEYSIKFNYDKEPQRDEKGNVRYDENGSIIYGDNTLIEGALTWVKNIEIDDYGTITTDYTTEYTGDDRNSEGNRVQSQLIKWITEASLDEKDGHFNITFNQLEENEDGTLSDNFQQYNNYLQWIKDIEVQNDGTIKYDGTQQDRSQNKLIKWINEFSLDEKDGHLLIKFNNDQLNTGRVETLDDESQISIIDKNLTWVKDITIDKEGTVTTDYTTEYTGEGKDDEGNRVQSHLLHWINQMNFADDGTVTVNFNNKDLNDGQIESGNITLPQLIKWITEVKLNNENGKFEIDFNYPEKTNKDGSIIPNTKTHYETDLTWVKDIQINSDNGQVTIDYTNLDNNTDTKLQWIKNITIDDDGTVKYDGTQQNSTQEKLITWIKSCSFDESTGNLKIDFNNNNKVSNIDTTINFIKQVAVTPTGQVLVLYSDPKQQGKISYDGIDTWTEVSQLPHSKCSSANLTDADKNEVINNLLPYTSCYWIEEIE